jgi:hypothetical protein
MAHHLIEFLIFCCGVSVGFPIGGFFAGCKDQCNCGASSFQAPQCGEPSGKRETAEGSPLPYLVK